MEGVVDRVKNVFRPRATPQEQLREWQRRLRQESRNVDRQVREIQREEKNAQKAVREALKRNDRASATPLAKEIVRSRKHVERLYANRAQMNSISMQLGTSVAYAKVVGNISKSTEVMKLVNKLMKAPELAVQMQELQKELIKAGVIEEMVTDVVSDVLDTEDVEVETEEEVEKVLAEIAGETIAQLPETSRRDKLKQTVEEEEQQHQQAVGEDDEAELEDLRARLDNVRS